MVYDGPFVFGVNEVSPCFLPELLVWIQSQGGTAKYNQETEELFVTYPYITYQPNSRSIVSPNANDVVFGNKQYVCRCN
jgi:hypothetical protein